MPPAGSCKICLSGSACRYHCLVVVVVVAPQDLLVTRGSSKGDIVDTGLEEDASNRTGAELRTGKEVVVPAQD